MAFNKKHYRTIKKFMSERLSTRPWCYEGNRVDWIAGFFDMVRDCAQREDYEGAQAAKDAIIEAFNDIGAEVPMDARLIFKNNQ